LLQRPIKDIQRQIYWHWKRKLAVLGVNDEPMGLEVGNIVVWHGTSSLFWGWFGEDGNIGFI